MRRLFSKIAFLVILMVSVVVCYAEDKTDDDFGPAKTINTEYFDLYIAPTVDFSWLSQRLDLRPSDEILAGRSSNSLGLASGIDSLFLRVCNILDIHLYSYRGKIKVCQDYNQLDSIYSGLFGTSLANRHSFYVFSLNTIYISADNFKREILGHEIGHAVISHYFVVLPPVKVQEVLAGYVEYQLRKAD